MPQRKRGPAEFTLARRAEVALARQLRRLAKTIAEIVASFPATADGAAKIEAALHAYAAGIEPWAKAVVQRMLADVDRRSRNYWRLYSKRLSVALQRELLFAPTGAAQAQLMKQAVPLITSLPLKEARRVHDLVQQNLYEGGRYESVAAEIMKTGKVTQARANLIARTETARAASTLTQARAQHVGSVEYIWRTMRDGAVRPSHERMEGKVVRWDNPPTLDNLVGHAGQLPNCRCFCEPIIPDID